MSKQGVSDGNSRRGNNDNNIDSNPLGEMTIDDLLNAINNPRIAVPSSQPHELAAPNGLPHNNQGMGVLQGIGNNGIGGLNNFFLPYIIRLNNNNQNQGSSLNELGSLLPRQFPFSGNMQQQQRLSLQIAEAQVNGLHPQYPQINASQIANLNQLAALANLNSLQLPQMGWFQDTTNSPLQNVLNANGFTGLHNSLDINNSMAAAAHSALNPPSNALNPLASQLADFLNRNSNSLAFQVPMGSIDNVALAMGNVAFKNEEQFRPNNRNVQQRAPSFDEEEETMLNSDGKPLKAREARWNVRYKELVQFQREHGHCRVPHGYAPNRKLAWWVMNQRAQHGHRKAGKKTWLTLERIQLLDDIGFVWTPHIKKVNKGKGAKKSPSGEDDDRKPSANPDC